jgi:signal transduction histidine kinase/DNA-binding response OmpR family regulator
MTAYAMDGDRERALVAGCDGYIPKPIDVDELPRQVDEFLAGRRERAETRDEGHYLRELNQRLLYRLLNQVEEMNRLNRHFVRRADQLEHLHEAVQDASSELDVRTLLERLLPAVGRALGTQSLRVELGDPALAVSVEGPAEEAPRVLPGGAAEESSDVEWKLPLDARGRHLGCMVVRRLVPPGARADEEQLLKIVANHVAIAVENSRLYEGMRQHALEQQSLVEAGRLLASSLEVPTILQRLAQLVQARLAADAVRIWLAEERPGDFSLRAEAGGAGDAGREPVEAGAGLVARIMEEGAPLAVPVVADEDGGAVSFLGVPLLLEEAPVGVLVALGRGRRDFTPGEIALAEALATSAAVAIRNARLHEETARRLAQTQTLVAVSQALGSTLDLTEVARRTVREMVRVLGADYGGAWRLTERRDAVVPLAGYHVPPDVAARLAATPSLPVGHLLAEVAAGPIYAVDAAEDPRLAGLAMLEDVPHRSVLVCALEAQGEVIGFFTVLWREAAHRFTGGELRLVEGIARQAAMAMQNSRLYAELHTALETVEASQQRIVQGERLRALGEMAGGVAHDFNNVLAIIIGRAEVLASDVDDPEVRRQLGVIIKAALDATQTVKRIQDFTRMSRSRRFQPVDLNHLLGEVREMARSRWKDEAEARGIRYEIRVEARPVPPVEGDPSEIREALTNILFNALDAMPGGGRVTLATSVEDGRVCCRIRDTGLGMPEDVRRRVFDPFFTTKGERGTGLGLSVVYGIVTRHGGEVDVQSRLGEGSTFTVRLPVATVTGGAAGTPAIAPASPTKGRILVVDDERDVSEAVRDLLTRDGHTVVVCRDGESALKRLDEERFDLVLTDLGMAGISGWEVARLAKLRAPDMPVAMITGRSERIDAAEARAQGVDFVIGKPFRRDDIRRVTAAALVRPTLTRRPNPSLPT